MARCVAILVVLLASRATCSGSSAESPRTEHWQSDVTESMAIGTSLTGYRSVQLRCAADHMLVDVEMDEDFDGVLYARGAFHGREEPCFLDATGGRNFSLRLPFAQCNTRDDDKLFSNTIVVQYDDELIMPGDAAFKLECDFRKPKDFVVSADLQDKKETMLSRISLEDADPAAQSIKKDNQFVVSSQTSSVIFNPNSAKKHQRDEL